MPKKRMSMVFIYLEGSLSQTVYNSHFLTEDSILRLTNLVDREAAIPVRRDDLPRTVLYHKGKERGTGLFLL